MDIDLGSARAEALARLPEGACTLLRHVEVYAVREDRSAPWQEVEVWEGSAAQLPLVKLIFGAVFDGDDRYIDPRPIHSEFRHGDPCPLCEHRAAPGPRVYGLFTRDHPAAPGDLASLEEFANMAAAQDHFARITASFAGRAPFLRRGEANRFRVWAEPGRVPDWGVPLLDEHTQLWLWTLRPRRLTWPDSAIGLDDRGAVHRMTGRQVRAQAEQAQALLEAGEAATSNADPVRVSVLDELHVVWRDIADPVIESVTELGSSTPATQVEADFSRAPLPGAPAGLTRYGRPWRFEFVPLSALPAIDPRYGHLADVDRLRAATVTRR